MLPSDNDVSSLLQFLPAIYSQDRLLDEPNFLGRFLLAFEKILLGLGDPAEPGFAEVIGGLHHFFEPGADLRVVDPASASAGAGIVQSVPTSERIPSDFLPWLAGWLAITFRQDEDESTRRNIIAKASELYALRGTKRGIEEFIKLYTVLGVHIDELDSPFQVGVRATVGRDTYVDGGGPFFFRVRALLPSARPEYQRKQRELARAIIDLQKPAHTHYDLAFESPELQVGVQSTVGVDTVL